MRWALAVQTSGMRRSGAAQQRAEMRAADATRRSRFVPVARAGRERTRSGGNLSRAPETGAGTSTALRPSRSPPLEYYICSERRYRTI